VRPASGRCSNLKHGGQSDPMGIIGLLVVIILVILILRLL
jgi:hypothetical protein